MKNYYSKIYYIITAIVFIIAILLFGVIMPLIKGIKTKSSDYVNNMAATNNLYADWLSLQTAEKTLKKIDKNRLKNIFLDPDQSLNFIVAVENIVKRNNLHHEIRILTLSPAAQNKGTINQNPALPFQLTVWGSFPNLMRLLKDIENLPYFVEIDIFEIQHLGDMISPVLKSLNLGVGDIKTTLNIKVYTK